MMGVAQARRLAQVRASERRTAAANVMAAMGAAAEAGSRVEQIIALTGLVAPGSSQIMGSSLAARGEFVGRLVTGHIFAAVQRARRAQDANEARRNYGLADARADIAQRGLTVAERLDVATTDRRTALKSFFKRKGS